MTETMSPMGGTNSGKKCEVDESALEEGARDADYKYLSGCCFEETLTKCMLFVY